MFYTNTDDVHGKPAESIEKKSSNNSKMIKIQLQMLLLMIILNHLKHKGKIITVSLHQVLKNL